MKKNIMRPRIYDFETYKSNKQRSTINCTIMKICANVYMRYRYSRAIQNVLSLSLLLSTIVLFLSFHF